ncbi:MAG: hypothetical protein LUC91_11615 [Prevotella sp.]|nr:hypothetical protein [Prevotella sp.]
MSFDYLNDLFGKFRKPKSKYVEVEKKVSRMLNEYVEGRYAPDEFADILFSAFTEFKRIYNENSVIDENYPLWLSIFFLFLSLIGTNGVH